MFYIPKWDFLLNLNEFVNFPTNNFLLGAVYKSCTVGSEKQTSPVFE